MVSTSHPNAKYYFERDVACIQRYFAKNYGMTFEGIPILETDVDRTVDLDKEIKASGFLNKELGKDIGKVTKLFDQVA
jgi:RIO kinase 2